MTEKNDKRTKCFCWLLQAVLDVGVKADLRNQFTWNTKQLYVYVMAEFASPDNPHNEMIVWNKIIRNQKFSKLSISKLPRMYPFVMADQDSSLRGSKVNITVAWNVMPYVGRLYTRSKTSSGHVMPVEYTQVASSKKGKS